MSQWQPIDTAPKEWGHMLLLCGREETHYVQGSNSGWAAGTYIYVGCWSEGFGERWVGGIAWPTSNKEPQVRWVEIYPTHWMPLPEEPTGDDLATRGFGV